MVAHCSSSNSKCSRAAAAICSKASYKEGQPAAAAAATIAGPQQQTKGHIYSSTLHCKLKVVDLLKGNAQKHLEKKR